MTRPPRQLILSRLALAGAVLGLTACGSAASVKDGPVKRTSTASGGVPLSHPQAVEPVAGEQASQAGGGDAPVGDPNAHAPPLSTVRQELKLELVAAPVTNGTYVDPLRFVTSWGRTDQGVDAGMPVGAPILAPCRVKILAVIPNWYAGQPLVYFELLAGADAGKIQYVAEQITAIAHGIIQQGQPIARYAASGTEIEYGWSTINGVTLAKATTGYEEGQVTPAGRSMRTWLNALGANAGPS
jgi:hypothetical protein